MKTQIIKTYLPVFPGFYNTIFEPSEEAEEEYINQERKDKRLPSLDYDDITFEYDIYREEVCEGAVRFVEDALISLEIIEGIKFEKMNSPKYYNYGNDSIDVEIEINPEKLSLFINERWEEFAQYLKRNYTSYDGFWSNHPNNPAEWRENTNNFMNNLSGHTLGSLLQFVCEIEDINQENMFYSMEIYLSVEDIEWEVNKIKCPECGEWFLDRSIVEKWNKQVDKDLLGKEYFGVSPKLRDFNEWMINNEINCGCI